MIVVGLSHRSAPIAVRERLAIAKSGLSDVLQQLVMLPGVSEAVVLSTCNRMEVYVASDAEPSEQRTVQDRVTRTLGELGGREVIPHLMHARGDTALRHLYRVACSLDSLVIGEPQILGQLKDAIAVATETGTLGRRLGGAMRSAVQVAKRVRTKTAIGSGQVSVPSVAVDLAQHIFEDLRGHTTLMVGAGEMAEAAAKLLARAGAQVAVVNRSPERGAKLAASIGAGHLLWEQLNEGLIQANIVIASTGSKHHVITRKQLKGLRRKRRGRSLFLIDIAVPRDIEPSVNDLDNVYLYDIDDLSHVVAESLAGRREQAERAEAMVRQEVLSFAQRQQEQAVKPTIVALRQRAREVLQAELSRSCRGRLKHLGDEERQALARMMDAAVNKLLHAPTARLKELAVSGQGRDASMLLSQLFELEDLVAAQSQRRPLHLAEPVDEASTPTDTASERARAMR